MTELKTLKDIEANATVADYDSGAITRFIKEEAIKWVKLYRDNDVVPKELKMFGGEIGFIKHFFNITEEDLK